MFVYAPEVIKMTYTDLYWPEVKKSSGIEIQEHFSSQIIMT